MDEKWSKNLELAEKRDRPSNPSTWILFPVNLPTSQFRYRSGRPSSSQQHPILLHDRPFGPSLELDRYCLDERRAMASEQRSASYRLRHWSFCCTASRPPVLAPIDVRPRGARRTRMDNESWDGGGCGQAANRQSSLSSAESLASIIQAHRLRSVLPTKHFLHRRLFATDHLSQQRVINNHHHPSSPPIPTSWYPFHWNKPPSTH